MLAAIIDICTIACLVMCFGFLTRLVYVSWSYYTEDAPLTPTAQTPTTETAQSASRWQAHWSPGARMLLLYQVRQ